MDSFIMKSGSAAGEGKQGGGAAGVEKQDFRSTAGIGGIHERPFSGSLGNPKLHRSCPPRRSGASGAPHLACEGIPSPVSARGFSFRRRGGGRCRRAEPADLRGGDRGESPERWKGLCWVFAKLGLNSSVFPKGSLCRDRPCAVTIPVLPASLCHEHPSPCHELVQPGAFCSWCIGHLAGGLSAGLASGQPGSGDRQK